MVFYLQIPLYQTIAIDSFSLLERKKIIGWALSRHNDLGKTKIGISSQDTIKLQCFLDPIQRRNDTLLSPKPKLRPGANQPQRSSPQAHDDDISIYNKYDLFRNKTRPFDRFRETLDVSYRRNSQNRPSTIAQGSISSLDFENVHFSPYAKRVNFVLLTT